jgi:hypothetical protein
MVSPFSRENQDIKTPQIRTNLPTIHQKFALRTEATTPAIPSTTPGPPPLQQETAAEDTERKIADSPDPDETPVPKCFVARDAPPIPTLKIGPALKTVLCRYRASLADDEKRHAEAAVPETDKFLKAKTEFDVVKCRFEDAKWAYARAKAEFEAHEQARHSFRARYREVDEAERELEELCHSRNKWGQ